MADLDYTSAYFEPPDMEAANDEWGASCGPGSFAALTSRTLADTRRCFPGFEQRGYTNPTQMQEALRIGGHRFIVTRGAPWQCAPAKLVLIQFTGPWQQPGVPAKAAYRYTHWIAARSELGSSPATWVYDVNVGFWISREDWAKHIAPELVALHKRATGWEVKQTISVEL